METRLVGSLVSSEGRQGGYSLVCRIQWSSLQAISKQLAWPAQIFTVLNCWSLLHILEEVRKGGDTGTRQYISLGAMVVTKMDTVIDPLLLPA